MITPVWRVVHNGKVDLPDNVNLEDGKRVLVTVLPPEEENEYWQGASPSALDAIGTNAQDDRYAELLQ